LTRGENCTWKSLIEALRSIYYIGLARKLEDWLNEAEAMKEGEVVVPVIGYNKGKPVYLLDSAGQPAYFDLPSKAFLGHDSSLLAEAMKEGEVVVPVIKVILVGTAGVGKTCVYHLLMGLPPPKERDSTGCATRPVRVIQIISGEEGEKWKEADLKKMLAEAVPILCGRLRKNAHKKESTDAKEGTDDTEGERGAKAAERKSEVQETDEVPKPEKSPLEKVIEEIVVELDKLVRDYEWRPFYDMQQLSLEKQAIYLTDSGGQQAFWDLVPIFICGPLTVLFVHRLCDKLGDKPLNEWYKDGKPVGQEGQRATLTTAEVFKLMCQGLESGGKSNVIVIGTHKDVYEKEEKPTENIKYKNEQFESCIPQDSKVYVTEAMDRVIFEVDTTLRVDENKAIAGELRKVIVQSTPLAKREDVDQKKETEESTGNELEPIPISWYVLQIVLEEAAKRLKREVLLVSECETMAKELSFRDDEVKAALRFFDKLNIFFYKESILPGVVFISSQVPLGCVTKLVQMRYKLLESKEKPSKPFKPTKDMWLQFRDHAKITRDLLKEIFEHHCHGREHKLPQDAGEHKKEEDVLLVEDIFTEKELLLLLNKLLIVAPTNKPLEYFCPALLEMVEVDGFLKKDDRVTRVVQFPGGYAPAGVFCCAVCYLQSKGNWKIRESDAVARNQVTFAVKGRLVTFTDKFQYFAVSIDQKDVRSKLCKEINKDMSEAIENALVATNKKTVLFKLSFLCPCTVHKALHPATVEQDDDEFNLVCSKESLISGTLNEYQKTWLESHSSGIIPI
jgi:GTPase SAR1 family protein